MSYPTITIKGNLGDKPKLYDHKSKEGKFATFTVYQNYSPKNPETGERVQKSEPFNMIAFGALADQCARQLERGERISVVARVKSKLMEVGDKKVRTYDFIAQNVERVQYLEITSIEYQIERGEKKPVEIFKDGHPRRSMDREI